MKRNPTWVRDELILALELYLKEGQIGPENPKVIALSDVLNALPIHTTRPDIEKFRNPNGVALKLANFRAIDPNDPATGMSAGGKGDKEIWTEFSTDKNKLEKAVQAIVDSASEGTRQTEGKIPTWINDIVKAFENLGGIAPYSKLYEEVRRLRKGSLPESWKAIIRREVEMHSSDSEVFSGKDLFYSASGIGKGIWGLRGKEPHSPKAADLSGTDKSPRSKTETYRILRDTALARTLKEIHGYSCQICGLSIDLSDGKSYAEAHHLMPLGSPHDGPDIAGNIVVLCPNHHVLCDYGAISLSASNFRFHTDHTIDEKYITYHNDEIVK